MAEGDQTKGKRTLPDRKIPLGGKIAIIAAAVLVAAAVGGYLGLCAYVSGGDTILPNVTASGVELGGLSQGEAQEKLEREGAARFTGQTVSFSYPGGTAQVQGTGIEIDTATVATAAYRQGREKGFLGGGAAYLGAMLGGAEIDAPIRFSPEGEKELASLVASIEDHLTQKVEQTSYQVKGNALVLVKGVSGMTIETGSIKDDLLSAFRAGETEGEAFQVEPQITAPDQPDFNAIYADVKVEEADAYLDKATKEVVPSVTGVSFDIPTAQALLERTEEGAVCQVPLTKSEPGMTTEKLTANLFKDVLGRTSTLAKGVSARLFNIRHAASFVNDTILLPGEVFSYNNTCEPYSTSNGYKNAGTYQNGKSVDAVAGGICQLSSTLYWATLEANLETVTRRAHSFDTGYLPIVGTDATVFSGSPDFQFKNDTEYPVKLEAYMDSKNNLHVIIRGTSNGIHGEPFNKVLSTVEPGVKYEPNSSVPQGSAPQPDPERYSRGGITVEVYLRLVDESGNTVETKFLHKDRYAMRDAHYFYHPADAALWGIDANGRKTLTPVTPTPSPSPSPSPVVPVDPIPTPSPSVDPSSSPEVPVGPVLPEVPVTPPPVETPPPWIPTGE